MKRASLVAVLNFSLWLGGGCADKGPDESPMDMAGKGPAPSCTSPKGTVHKTAISRLIMPTGAKPCSIDLDGDGKPDNKLAVLAAGIKATFDLQGTADNVFATGDLVELLGLQTEDTSDSTCAGVALQRGLRPPAAPMFDGQDMFMADPNFAPAKFVGVIQGGMLTTPLPSAQTDDTLVRLGLSLPAGFGVEIPLPLLGGHLSGGTRSQGLIRGELHGAVRAEDVTKQVIPAIASVMTEFVHHNPNTAAAQSLITMFESKSKCDTTPKQCCRLNPTTCQITAQEVQANALVQEFLQPDVQMFSGGKWGPNPRAETPDSLSVGVCFTAVAATF